MLKKIEGVIIKISPDVLEFFAYELTILFYRAFPRSCVVQLNAHAVEAGVQVSPHSNGTLCCLWLFQVL